MNLSEMFNKYRGLIVFLLVVFLGFFIYRTWLVKPSMISVTGDGTVEVVPSQAKVTATLGFSASKGDEALKGAKQLLEAITSTLSSQGIKKESIQSLSFSVSSVGTGETKVYRATGALEVTVDDIKKTDQVVETLLSLGVTDIPSIALTTKDAKDLEKKAVSEAINNAKERAKEIAKTTGKRLSRLISVTTSEQGGASAMTTKGGSQGLGEVIEIRRQAVLVYEIR